MARVKLYIARAKNNLQGGNQVCFDAAQKAKERGIKRKRKGTFLKSLMNERSIPSSKSSSAGNEKKEEKMKRVSTEEFKGPIR